MSFDVEGKQCQYCHAKLFKEDDVVICPDCGAPYHRECYNSLGHCALEQFHGTDESYENKQKAESEKDPAPGFTPDNSGVDTNVGVKCQMCGEEYSRDASSCPKCGTPNVSKFGGNAVFFDFLGGVAPDCDLGDGVTADEAKKFVMANTNKYIPKFAKMKSGKKTFFNFLAFLFPVPWLLSRKMYTFGALMGAIEVAVYTIMYPYLSGLNTFSGSTSTMTVAMRDYLAGLSKTNIIIFFSLIAFLIIIQVLMGLFGDLIYRNYVISSIKELKASDGDFDEGLRKKGGVSLIMLMVGFLVVRYLPGVIVSFAGV
ncbi:MAG: DUF2628 domain-containing protein [Clostridia bacterium]|nr:DUF2628 domain-containing protein [Clostridia bacterium]